MTIPKTDVEALALTLIHAPVEAGLPYHLGDELLLQIGRDLRLAENACENDEDANVHADGAGYLVLHLLSEHAVKLFGHPEREVMFARLDRWVPKLEHWIARYRYYLEREIVSRAIQMPCQKDSDELLAEIEADIRTFE